MTLTCEVTKEGERLTWLKDDEPVAEDGIKYEMLDDGLRHSLVIRLLKRTDQAEYKCTYGKDTTSCVVLVEGIVYTKA